MKVVTNFSKGDWDKFINSIDTASSYHQFGWGEVISRSFEHDCYYLTALDEQDLWQGVLPLVHMRSKLFGNFLISVPFANYGGLLYQNDAAVTFLLNEAEKIRQSCEADYIELRHVTPCVDYIPTKKHKVTMILELCSDVDGQWKAFNPKLRNQIRKAQKSNLEFSIGHLDLLDDFYKVFARNMRDLGTPVYGKEFFFNILNSFQDTARIFVVRHQNSVIAAAIALWFRDTLEIPWASSINDYRNLCPNNMLYWEAIRFSIENGFKKFDFGRSTPYEGTYNFKKQWGALPIQLHWQYLMDKGRKIPELNPSNPKYQAAVRIWQHLPVSLTKLLGPVIVRNIP